MMNKRIFSIRLRLLLFLFLVILLFLVIGIAIYLNSQKKMFEQYKLFQSDILNQYNLNLDEINSYSNYYSNNLMIDKDIISLISSSDELDVTERTQITNFLFDFSLNRNDVDFIGIINSKSLDNPIDLTFNGFYKMKDYNSFSKNKYVQDFIDNDYDSHYYYVPEKENSFLDKVSNDSIVMIRTIRDFQRNFEVVGYFVVGLSLNSFNQINSKLVGNIINLIFIVDEFDNIVFKYGDSSILSNIKINKDELNFKHESYIYSSSNNNRQKWKIFLLTNTNQIRNMTYNDSLLLLLTIFLIIIIILFFYYVDISRMLVNPLKNLVSSMSNYEPGNNQPIESNRNDEIGILILNYNRLVNDIDTLIKQNYEIKIQEQKALLASLQSQINPHFLYNTLDLLYWQANLNGQSELSNNILSLSTLFRSSLNKGQPWISFKKEKEFILAYLQLQNAIKSNQFEYIVEMDESLEENFLPRFIVQPFVENSILHGLDEAEIKQQLIKIEFKDLKNNQAKLVISDNGKGMNDFQCKSILERKTNTDSKSYGLSNVIKRLELYYDSSYSLDIDSKIGEGTIVTVILPLGEDFCER